MEYATNTPDKVIKLNDAIIFVSKACGSCRLSGGTMDYVYVGSAGDLHHSVELSGL